MSFKSILITKTECEFIAENYPDEHEHLTLSGEGEHYHRATANDSEVLEFVNEVLNAEGPNKLQ